MLRKKQQQRDMTKVKYTPNYQLLHKKAKKDKKPKKFFVVQNECLTIVKYSINQKFKVFVPISVIFIKILNSIAE